MSYFNTHLDVRAVDGGWLLLRPLEYHSEFLGRKVYVPIEFFTDLASVPKWARWLIPVANAKNRPAAVVHDFLCDPAMQKVFGIDQMGADRVFREALAVCNVNPVGQWGMWLPVRIFQFIKGMRK